MSADVLLDALGLEEFQVLEVVENKEEATLVHVFANTMTYAGTAPNSSRYAM